MQTQTPDSGPSFATDRRQSNPACNVHDMGIILRWGSHTARIYRQVRPPWPPAFMFEDTLVHEDDVDVGVEYLTHLACKTRVGTFIPLTSHLAQVCRFRKSNPRVHHRIRQVLAQLDRILPPDQSYDAFESGLQADQTQRTAQGQRQAPAMPAPATGMLTADLEIEGFRLSNRFPEEGYTMVEISWNPQGSQRVFFTGVLLLRPTPEGIKGQWGVGGHHGVDELLREDFQKVCSDVGNCLTPEGRKHCMIVELPRHAGKAGANRVKHDPPCLQNHFKPQPDATSSSNP